MSEQKEVTYLIGKAARILGVHPQTLRIYEREGLLSPRRSESNTRLYSELDVRRAELVITLSRDLGINLAGVEVILRMRDRIEQMQTDLERFFISFPDEVKQAIRRHIRDEKAIVPIPERRVIQVKIESAGPGKRTEGRNEPRRGNR